ncbi:alkaline phosphatase family protein [Rhizobium sp. 0TCS1.26]|uniref:alkaline phosphatase family protein n=1 Tax=Rhizobium sp. 0TCS1.26 TaxID=3142623 RepID=UPI003D2862EB
MKAGSCLIVTFDGLRRDRATPSLMPNLARFMTEGSDFINSRSVFPSETRVAVTSTATGCPPAAHGLVANQYLHPATPGRPFQTADYRDLMAAAALGQLIDRPSLGDRLAAAGRTMAVVSTATPGATWMMNPNARTLGHPVFSVYGPPVSTSPLHEAALAAFGPVPEAGTPNNGRIDYATRVLTELVYAGETPDVCILWLSDPDITSHGFGVFGAETEQAQAHADAAFGKILELWRAGRGPENLIVMSDHGQITGSRQVEPARLLPQWASRMSTGSFNGIYLDDRSSGGKQAAIDVLSDLDWVGLIFADADAGKPLEGAMPWSLVGNGHPRGPDVGFTLSATPPSDAAGDECYFSAHIQPGGGMHGGLNRGELSTVLAGAGPAFKAGFKSDVPCWLPDIAPTVMAILGLGAEGMEGRVLGEGLVGGPAAPAFEKKLHSICHLGHEQHLSYWQIGNRTIVDCGWTSGSGAWR